MKTQEVNTVSSPEDGYCAWPTLLQRRNGELLAVCSGRRSRHISPDGRVLLYRSPDEGKNWSRPQVLTHGPLDDRDAGIIELADGTLVVTWFTSMAWGRALLKDALSDEERRLWGALLGDEERERWRMLRGKLENVLCEAALGCWAICSSDGGQTWSAPVTTHVGNPHGPILLRDGRLLLVGSIRAEEALSEGRNGSPFSSEIGAAVSCDSGCSWTLIGKVPAAPGDETAHYHEPHAVETTPGRILMLLRNHNPATHGEMLVSFSNDSGSTWSPPSSIGRCGYPAHLVSLRSGSVIASYSHRQEPRSIRAVISHDQGASWSEPHLIAPATGADFGYPSSIELQNGDLLTLWYERGDDEKIARLKTKRWRWEDEAGHPRES